MTANEDLVLLLKYALTSWGLPLPSNEELMEIVLRWKKEAF